MVLMEGRGEFTYSSSSSSTSASDESDDEIQSNPEEVPTRSLIPAPAPAPTTSTAVVGSSHVVEIPNINASVLGTPLVGSTPVLGYPFTQFQQTRPITLEIPNPNVALVPAVNQTQQTINSVENLGNYFPQGPDPRPDVLPPGLAATRHRLAEAAREIVLTRRAMYPPIRPMTTENNSNGAPMTWPSWNISNQNFHGHQTSSTHPQVGLGCIEQCCAAFSIAQTAVPTTNHHATAYLPMMVPYQIEQPMPQPPMMGQNIVNPTRFQAEASASGPPTARRMRSLVYDPAYERMGLPVDPHLRAFLASPFNKNK